MQLWTQFDRAQKIFVVLIAIFLSSLIIANLIGSMLFSFRLPGLAEPVLLSAGIIPFPVTFILTDLINEFYGKAAARFITYVGFAMSLLVFAYLSVGELLPVDAISQITKPQYLHITQLYSGMFTASLAAYLIGQLLDIQIFHLFRKLTKHRFIWLRATGSTVISQLFDSILVTFIAFWGDHALHDLWRLALGNYTWKFIIAVGITPFLYLGHMVLARLMPGQDEMTETAEAGV